MKMKRLPCLVLCAEHWDVFTHSKAAVKFKLQWFDSGETSPNGLSILNRFLKYKYSFILLIWCLVAQYKYSSQITKNCICTSKVRLYDDWGFPRILWHYLKIAKLEVIRNIYFPMRGKHIWKNLKFYWYKLK